jgi:hypothetical protein
MNISSIVYDEDVYETFASKLKTRNFRYLGHGSFRRVYERKNIVVKVPTMQDGLYDNMIEAYAWRQLRDRPTQHGIVCAPNRLLPNGCLMMVKLDTKLYDENGAYRRLPGWVDAIEKNQVGFYKGRVVAYDYAIDIVERHAWERALNIESDFFKNEYVHRNTAVRDPEVDYDDQDEYNEDGECNCVDCRRDREQANKSPEPIKEDERLL